MDILRPSTLPGPYKPRGTKRVAPSGSWDRVWNTQVGEQSYLEHPLPHGVPVPTFLVEVCLLLQDHRPSVPRERVAVRPAHLKPLPGCEEVLPVLVRTYPSVPTDLGLTKERTRGKKVLRGKSTGVRGHSYTRPGVDEDVPSPSLCSGVGGLWGERVEKRWL